MLYGLLLSKPTSNLLPFNSCQRVPTSKCMLSFCVLSHPPTNLSPFLVGPTRRSTTWVRKRWTRNQEPASKSGRHWAKDGNSYRRDQDQSPGYHRRGWFIAFLLPDLQQNLCASASPQQAHEVSFGHQEVPLYVLREGIQWHLRPQKAYENTHR